MRDRMAESVSRGPVVERVSYGLLHARQRHDRGRQALALEVVHDVVKTLVHLAQYVAGGDAALVEEKLGGVGGHIANLLKHLAYLKALGLGGKQNQRHA